MPFTNFVLFVGTGLRVAELHGLDVDDVNLRDHSVYVTRKGQIKKARVYFNDDVATVLCDYIENERPKYLDPDSTEPALFLSNRKRRLAIRSIEEMLAKYGEGLNDMGPEDTLHPHLLRRTFGTALYNATSDIQLVADVLGHSNIAVTQKHYARVEEEHRKKNRDIDLFN